MQVRSLLEKHIPVILTFTSSRIITPLFIDDFGALLPLCLFTLIFATTLGGFVVLRTSLSHLCPRFFGLLMA